MTDGFARLRSALSAPVDAASLAAFRALFGFALFFGIVRFVANGWVDTLLTRPSFHFKYSGFAWVPVLPPAGMYALYAVMAVGALAIAIGWRFRIAAAVFTVTFAWAELVDVTNYLNHYYLVVLLGVLMTFLPMHTTLSVDRGLAPATVPAWVLWLLRFQVAVVYFYAGLAKAGSDWLVHGQPLGIWLAARTETPVLGPLFALPWVPLAMSWAGFLFDTTIVGWLLWRRSRPIAYVVVVAFHLVTASLFQIGLFPVLMPIAATLFFAPDWPRKLFARLLPAAPVSAPVRAPSRLVLAVAAAWCVLQVAIPLRHFAYPGDVLWTEEGMRWSWKVMVRAKTGAVTFRVRDPQSGREWQVSPLEYLQPRQVKEMSSQPDLIVQLAKHIAGDFARRGRPGMEVRADALVSLNGRRAHPMIDPAVDLARVEHGLAPAAWILPTPVEPPLPSSPALAVAR